MTIDPRTATNEEFHQWVVQLGADLADPVEGFFGPESMMWQVSGELALYFAGMRALLLQIEGAGEHEHATHHVARTRCRSGS